MTKTKKSLVSSTLALIMCIAMLIATTFAWFTDSVASGKNTIKAGNLDIAMYYADGTKAVPTEVGGNGWKAVAEDEAIFNYQLWEPGYTVVKHIKIANEGSLALKYRLAIEMDGEVGDLAKALDVYATDTATPIPDRASVATSMTRLGTLYDVLKDGDLDLGGNLMPKDSKDASGNAATYEHALTIAVKMQEEAGNVYQGKEVGAFTVAVHATQYAYEGDAFDNKYDVSAAWTGETAEVPAEQDGVITITTAEQLAGFAKSVNSGTTYKGKTIKLGKDIDLNNVPWTPIKANKNEEAFTFDGNNKTIRNLKVNGERAVGLFGYATSLTIKNLNIVNANVKGINHVGVIAGNALCTKIDNCKVTTANITTYVKNNDDGDKAGAIAGYLSGEPVAYIKNCTVSGVAVIGYRDIGGIVGYENGQAAVSGNTISSSSIKVQKEPDYKEYSGDLSKHDAHPVIGERVSTATESNNTATDVSVGWNN